jgi:hypothetical protein
VHLQRAKVAFFFGFQSRARLFRKKKKVVQKFGGPRKCAYFCGQIERESMTVMKDSYLQVRVDALQARVKSPESKCCFITVSIHKR